MECFIMECFICLNELDMSENIFYLKCCNNYLHTNCIKNWVNNNNNNINNTCPYCRSINNDIIDLSNTNTNIDIIINNNYSNMNQENKNYKHLCYCIIPLIILLIIGLVFLA